MGYYSGGLRGDYYRGDAGFLSTLAHIGSGIASFIPGVGGMVSKGLEGLATGLESKGAAKAATAAVVPISKIASSGARPGLMGKAVGVARAHPVLTAAGAAGVAGAALGAGGMKVRAMLGAGGKRHRRMRVTNPKALRRAIRRATGFAHLAKKVLSFTERRPHRGRAVFKKFRRAKRVC